MSPRPVSIKPALLVFLCVLLAAGRASALSTDKNQPIDIHADHGDFKADPKNAGDGTGTYTGHVVITQGSIVLHADKAVLRVVNNDLTSADMTGNPATFQQQPDNGEVINGSAQEITYDASTSEIVLITAARLTQAVAQAPANRPPVATEPEASTAANPPGERLMTADVIHFDTNTQHVIAKSGDESQRVHLSFPPKAPAPAPATAAKPVKGRKSITVAPAAGSHAPMTLGAPPHAPAPAPVSTPAPPAASYMEQAP